MAASIDINTILSQVKKLDKEDQFNLLQKLVLLLKIKDAKKNSTLRLTSLSGLGSEMWANVNIDNYIDEGRQW